MSANRQFHFPYSSIYSLSLITSNSLLIDCLSSFTTLLTRGRKKLRKCCRKGKRHPSSKARRTKTERKRKCEAARSTTGDRNEMGFPLSLSHSKHSFNLFPGEFSSQKPGKKGKHLQSGKRHFTSRDDGKRGGEREKKPRSTRH